MSLNIDEIPDDFCSICHQKYTKKPFKLSCGHEYDVECIIEWLQMPESEGECPICRYNPHKKSDVDEINDEINDDDENDDETNITFDMDIVDYSTEKKKYKQFVYNLLKSDFFNDRIAELLLEKNTLSKKIKERKKEIKQKLKNIINDAFTSEELLEFKNFQKKFKKLEKDVNKMVPKDELAFPLLSEDDDLKKFILNNCIKSKINVPHFISYSNYIIREKLKFPFNFIK
jgi:hypothetical protein